jgi:hypothetical protein
VGCAFAVFVFLLTPKTVADPDIWWHLRDAEWQLGAHAFLRADVFSYTVRGTPWMNHEWLAELPFYFGWRMLGATGLFLVELAALEAIFLGVFWLAYRRSRSPMAALAVSSIGALLATVSFGPRTLLFGWLCLVAELLILERFQRRANAVWLLPPLFAVWVNLHGSWLIGMAVLGIFVAGGWFGVEAGSIRNAAWRPEQRRRLLLAMAASAAALLVNPYGWRLVAYPFDMAFRQKLNIANVEEWRPLDVHSPRGRILLAVLALLFLWQLLRQRRWTLCELGFLALGVYAAVSYSRFLFLAAILTMPVLLEQAGDDAGTRTKPNRPWANALLLLFLVPTVVRHWPSATTLENAGAARFPVRAAEYLSAMQPRGRVFNEFLWGGFLIWNDRQIPVMIDSRVDIFEYQGVFADYLDAVRLKDTFAVFDKYGIRYVVFPRETPLVYVLEHSPGWKIDYEDGTTAVLERTAERSAARR